MDINSFLHFRSNCIVCDMKNRLLMRGSMIEDIWNIPVTSIFYFQQPVIRKDFITFSINSLVRLSSYQDYGIDVDTLDINKYSSFILHSNNIITFDKEFSYKMKLSFIMTCPSGHYSYSSRKIIISDTSPDITKGYDVMTEELRCGQYKVHSDKKINETHIFNTESKESRSPIVIPYKEIISFPYDDDERCIKKIENILLLV